MKKLVFTFIALMCCTVMNAQYYSTFWADEYYNCVIKSENTVGIIMAYNLPGSVVIPTTVTNPADNKTYNVTSIEDHSFVTSKGITSVTIPEGITYIGNDAFGGCQITDLVIPSTVTSIGDNAFDNCSSLTSVTIKSGSIGEYAFNRCSNLTSISLQEGVTSIGAQAFCECKKIAGDLVIPSTVTNIGEKAFYDVKSTSVKVFALVPPELGDQAFGDGVSFYVPDVEKYKKCDGWKDYSIELLTGFTLGVQMYYLDEKDGGRYLDQELTFNDKDTYVSGFDFTAKKLTYSRTFTNKNWQPLYVPFAISYGDLETNFDVAAINNFHEYTDDMGQTWKTELEVRLVKSGTLKPNHPYLIKAHSANATKAQEINISSKKMYKSDENSIVCSSVERKYTFTGTYRDITGMRTKDYIFLSDGSLYRATDDNVKLSAQRWYLSIESLGSQVDGGNTSDAKPMEFDIKLLDDEATDIDEITVTRTPLRNSSEAIYNLNGMRVNDSYKGIVIKNGKKVLQK